MRSAKKWQGRKIHGSWFSSSSFGVYFPYLACKNLPSGVSCVSVEDFNLLFAFV